jgi:uncharacterized 2Fe-2S/4Fe-4S cluster protein (DUF4445 family)
MTEAMRKPGEEKEIRVLFEPSGRTVYVLPGTTVQEAAALAGHVIEQPCGGRGTCGKCLVRIAAGRCADCAAERGKLDPTARARGFRLACQCRIQEPLTIEIPESSLFQSAHRILDSDAGHATETDPLVRKQYVELRPPDREDPRADLVRLEAALGGPCAGLAVARQVPEALRAANFAVTATVSDERILRIESGDTRGRLLGLAFDLGTTTLVGTLVDLCTGRDLATRGGVNPQTSAGDDVVSRIRLCRDSADGLETLRTMIVAAVNRIIAELTAKTGADAGEICAAVFSGNTTMQQIFAGIHPRALGEIPFVPAFGGFLRATAAELGLNLFPGADVRLMPQIGGFVGGDTTAGIVATDLEHQKRPVLLVDVGTNGEVVLARDGRLVATSVAAGPAFEGARIVHGMRATRGAIEKVLLAGDVRVNVIGDAKPCGLCGSALIDAAAELLRVGVLDPAGRILGPDELPAGLPDAIRRRVVPAGAHFNFVLVDAAHAAAGEPLCLFQRDVRELQLANGAIRAGIRLLLRSEGLEPEDLSEVLLAGGFGNFIRRSSALRIGMLPCVPHDRIRFVGNTSSLGAKRVLLSRAQARRAEQVAAGVRHLDLSLSPDFPAEFGAAMLFPETV